MMIMVVVVMMMSMIMMIITTTMFMMMMMRRRRRRKRGKRRRKRKKKKTTTTMMLIIKSPEEENNFIAANKKAANKILNYVINDIINYDSSLGIFSFKLELSELKVERIISAVLGHGRAWSGCATALHRDLLQPNKTFFCLSKGMEATGGRRGVRASIWANPALTIII